ncbi:hypothetical protein V8E36_002226 [Tilletia maclaganii]
MSEACFTLKGNWKEVKCLVGKSGFGWDSEKLCITAEESFWADLIKSQSTLKRWKNKTFPLFDALDRLCSKSTATGQNARDGKRKADSSDGEEEESSDSDDEDGLVPPSRKRSRPSAVGALGDIAGALKSLAASEESIGSHFERLLEKDGNAFDHDELAAIGLQLGEKPLLAQIWQSYGDRDDARRQFLCKLLL